jgi:hypothetical protein
LQFQQPPFSRRSICILLFGNLRQSAQNKFNSRYWQPDQIVNQEQGAPLNIYEAVTRSNFSRIFTKL